jgi:hypothetical protein
MQSQITEQIQSCQKYFRELSIVQEVFATPQGKHYDPNCTLERVAVFLWKFRQTEAGETATTTWRRLTRPESQDLPELDWQDVYLSQTPSISTIDTQNSNFPDVNFDVPCFAHDREYDPITDQIFHTLAIHAPQPQRPIMSLPKDYLDQEICADGDFLVTLPDSRVHTSNNVQQDTGSHSWSMEDTEWVRDFAIAQLEGMVEQANGQTIVSSSHVYVDSDDTMMVPETIPTMIMPIVDATEASELEPEYEVIDNDQTRDGWECV